MNTTGYKIGDEVRIITDMSNFHGQVGVIVGISEKPLRQWEDSKFNYQVRVGGPLSGRGCIVPPYCLELVH